MKNLLVKIWYFALYNLRYLLRTLFCCFGIIILGRQLMMFDMPVWLIVCNSIGITSGVIGLFLVIKDIAERMENDEK